MTRQEVKDYFTTGEPVTALGKDDWEIMAIDFLNKTVELQSGTFSVDVPWDKVEATERG